MEIRLPQRVRTSDRAVIIAIVARQKKEPKKVNQKQFNFYKHLFIVFFIFIIFIVFFIYFLYIFN
jgi:cell division septal protein FtsQ